MSKLSKLHEKIRLKIRKFYIKKTAKSRQKKIHCKNFTIISNNCWAGTIYQSYNLPYQTPTIGLFILPDDYLKFVSDLKNYLKKDLVFIDSKESKQYQILHEEINFPVARLGDIEIYFMHYHSEAEVIEKWQRRCKRINFDNILYKFSDQNFCTKKHLETFMSLSLKNKVCFSSKNYNIDGIIVLGESFGRENSTKGGINASYEPFGSNRHININNLINNITCSKKD